MPGALCHFHGHDKLQLRSFLACCVAASCSGLLEAGSPGSLTQVQLQSRKPAFSLLPFSEPNLGEDDEDKDLEPGPSGTSKASAQISGQSDTDITAEFLQPLLTPDNVANLVRRVRLSLG